LGGTGDFELNRDVMPTTMLQRAASSFNAAKFLMTVSFWLSEPVTSSARLRAVGSEEARCRASLRPPLKLYVLIAAGTARVGTCLAFVAATTWAAFSVLRVNSLIVRGRPRLRRELCRPIPFHLGFYSLLV
jgi:hypothetical protein